MFERGMKPLATALLLSTAAFPGLSEDNTGSPKPPSTPPLVGQTLKLHESLARQPQDVLAVSAKLIGEFPDTSVCEAVGLAGFLVLKNSGHMSFTGTNLALTLPTEGTRTFTFSNIETNKASGKKAEIDYNIFNAAEGLRSAPCSNLVLLIEKAAQAQATAGLTGEIKVKGAPEEELREVGQIRGADLGRICFGTLGEHVLEAGGSISVSNSPLGEGCIVYSSGKIEQVIKFGRNEPLLSTEDMAARHKELSGLLLRRAVGERAPSLDENCALKKLEVVLAEERILAHELKRTAEMEKKAEELRKEKEHLKKLEQMLKEREQPDQKKTLI